MVWPAPRGRWVMGLSRLGAACDRPGADRRFFRLDRAGSIPRAPPDGKRRVGIAFARGRAGSWPALSRENGMAWRQRRTAAGMGTLHGPGCAVAEIHRPRVVAAGGL